MVCKITFQPDNIQISVGDSLSIKDAALKAGVEIEGPCGGRGTCGKCLVRLTNQQESQWIMACQTAVTNDTVVEIPQLEISLYRKSEITKMVEKVDLNPQLRKVALELQPPSLENQTADADRLLKKLGHDVNGLKLEALRSLPRAVQQDTRVTVVLKDNQVLAVEAGDTTGRLYGLAVDMVTGSSARAAEHQKSIYLDMNFMGIGIIP